MKAFLYRAGRAFQLIALLTLPSAIWVAEIDHSERGAIAIFVGCLALFSAGYLLSRLAR
jgi:hypothetical protein